MKLPVINLPAQPAMHSAAMLALAATLIATPFPAHADDKRTVGEIQGSGLVFKDTLKVEAFSCLLYTSPSPRDEVLSRMPSSA